MPIALMSGYEGIIAAQSAETLHPLLLLSMLHKTSILQCSLLLLPFYSTCLLYSLYPLFVATHVMLIQKREKAMSSILLLYMSFKHFVKHVPL
jgi:hypothetical protein